MACIPLPATRRYRVAARRRTALTALVFASGTCLSVSMQASDASLEDFLQLSLEELAEGTGDRAVAEFARRYHTVVFKGKALGTGDYQYLRTRLQNVGRDAG